MNSGLNSGSNAASQSASDALRSRVRTVAGEVGRPALRRLWARVEDIAAQHAGRVAEDVAVLRGELTEVRDALAGLRGELAEVRDRLEPVEVELHRIGAQQAAVETRTSALERPPVAGAADQQSVALVEEIRAEHARVRARLTAVAHYEERLGKVEEALRRTDAR
jgi:chromosome segregation ATPase